MSIFWLYTIKLYYKARYKNHTILISTFVLGKSIPLQAWTGPESCRRLRLPDFKKIGT